MPSGWYIWPEKWLRGLWVVNLIWLHVIHFSVGLTWWLDQFIIRYQNLGIWSPFPHTWILFYFVNQTVLRVKDCISVESCAITHQWCYCHVWKKCNLTDQFRSNVALCFNYIQYSEWKILLERSHCYDILFVV